MKTRKVRQRQWNRYLRRLEPLVMSPHYPPLYVERRYDKMLCEIERVGRRRLMRNRRAAAKSEIKIVTWNVTGYGYEDTIMQRVNREIRTRVYHSFDEAVWGPGGYEANKDRSSIRGIL